MVPPRVVSLVLPSAEDKAEALDHALAQAAEADLLLLSGGVSAGKIRSCRGPPWPVLALASNLPAFASSRQAPGLWGAAKRASRVFSIAWRGAHFAVLWASRQSSLFRRHLSALCGAHCWRRLQAVLNLAHALPWRGSQKIPTSTASLDSPAFSPRPAPQRAVGQLPEVALVPSQGSGDLAALARCNCFLVVPEETSSLEAAQLSAFCSPEHVRW